MSAYSIFNAIGGGCILGLILSWIFFWVYQRQARLHREEIRRLQQQLIMEVKRVHKLN
ncbi:hypothetical protein [Pseudescherichia vulneris]|uniref:hypothetical protein n=1 Tax=Pseudescherichia vulneris TaxID=566 RepID=UPI0028D2503A|nr:hypothetical protein [Pseudescherichia vulneris]